MTSQFGVTQYARAVIPSNSLMLFFEAVEGELDMNISRLRATSSRTALSDKTQPHKFLKLYTRTLHDARVEYNLKRAKEPFDLHGVVESLAAAGVADLWIHELHLRFKHDMGIFDFVFKNRPITVGSDAEKYVMNYIKKMKMQGLLKIAQIRHLALTTTLSIPEGNNLDRTETESPIFINWLSKKTKGLVKVKILEKVDETTFRDVKILG